jgi:hypothetical protein
MHTIETSAAISPYSIEVTPVSLLMKRAKRTLPDVTLPDNAMGVAIQPEKSGGGPGGAGAGGGDAGGGGAPAPAPYQAQ